MDNITDNSLPGMLKYLPGIYQEQGAIPKRPLWALLHIFDSFFNDIEETLEQLPNYFDADTVPLAENVEDDFLSWLANWVVLSLDRDILAEGLDDAIKQRRWRRLIKDAAMLYRLRGTTQGLRYMVEAVYGVGVEIIERAWPQGMVIGVSSSIEEQTYIIDPPEYARSFIFLIKLSTVEQSAIENSLENWIDVPYGTEDFVQKGNLQVCVDRKTGSEEDIPYLEKLRKIRHLVNQEKPIHTQCFIAFQGRKLRAEVIAVRPCMVVGVESTIEEFIIDEE